jgi:predicted nucleic acid-binding protein
MKRATGATTRGATLDTGFLVALEHRKASALALLRLFHTDRAELTVPAVVLAEWWRASPGHQYVRSTLPASFKIESIDRTLAEAAGTALARLRKKGRTNDAVTIDALVMASAQRRGDVVYTSDPADLALLSEHFPRVRVRPI